MTKHAWAHTAVGFCLLIVLALAAPLYAESVSWDEAMSAVAESLAEEIDWPAVASLAGLDEEQLQAVCREIQDHFQGEYVFDLVSMRDLAQALLPLLEQHAETQPYAAWLRARMDLLEVAHELRLTIPPPEVELPLPAPRLPNPSPELERRAWRERLQKEPIPSRAERYVARLKPVFFAEGVPPALVWLAEVESGFDPRARSPAGAAGLYQLMPDTAGLLGLGLRPVDERLDPVKSARAAARYLKYLYGKFADWTLVVAAYNGGEGRVHRLLEARRTRRYEEIAVHLPAETQMYVPKVESALLRWEGVALADLKPPRAGS